MYLQHRERREGKWEGKQKREKEGGRVKNESEIERKDSEKSSKSGVRCIQESMVTKAELSLNSS